MNISNLTSTNFCVGYETYNLVGHYLSLVGNYVVAPITLFFGFIGHFLCLLIYCRQLKKGNTAYVYQIFIAGSQILDIFQKISFLLMYQTWSGLMISHADWFTSCYPCMWYTSHVLLALSNTIITIYLMFTVCMAADRVLALMKPEIYRNLDHKKHQIIAFLLCLIISGFTGASEIMTKYLEEDGSGNYKAILNYSYVNGLGMVFMKITVFIRSFSLLVLIVLSIISGYLYHKKAVVQVEHMYTDKTLAKRKKVEKMLVILCVCQSTFNTLNILNVLLVYAVAIVNRDYYICGDVVAYVFYIIDWCVRATDFYVMAAASKQFRGMVYDLLPFLKRSKVTPEANPIASRVPSRAPSQIALNSHM